MAFTENTAAHAAALKSEFGDLLEQRRAKWTVMMRGRPWREEPLASIDFLSDERFCIYVIHVDLKPNWQVIQSYYQVLLMNIYLFGNTAETFQMSRGCIFHESETVSFTFWVLNWIFAAVKTKCCLICCVHMYMLTPLRDLRCINYIIVKSGVDLRDLTNIKND